MLKLIGKLKIQSKNRQQKETKRKPQTANRELTTDNK